MHYSTTYNSPVGMLTMAGKDGCLTGLWLEGQKYYGSGISDILAENGEMTLFTTVKSWLDRYFSGEKPDINELPLAPAGSDFRKIVWDILCDIPYGGLTTYGDIARKTAEMMNRKNMSGQAVGGAVGHNPISIIIPCHRVVGSNGSLTGYAGGIKTKIKLLELEGADMSRLFVPQKGTAL